MKAILAFVSVLFVLAFVAGTASATVNCVNGTINGTKNGTKCNSTIITPTTYGAIKIDLKQVSLVSPWFAPVGIRDHLVAVFEILFHEDLYIGGRKLSSLALNDPVVDFVLPDEYTWYPGEVVHSLADTLTMTCGPKLADVTDMVYVLPAVDNPLGLIYGWQDPLDNSTRFPADQLVLVLELDQVESTDIGHFYADPVYAFNLDILKGCHVVFNEKIKNKNGTRIPDKIYNFTAAEWNDCDPTTLATEREAMASAIDDYAVNVAMWISLTNTDPAVGAGLAYAALPLWAESWTMCEADAILLTGWSYGLASEEASYCNKSQTNYNATCDALTSVNLLSVAGCEVYNKKWDTDPCCNSSMTACCVEKTVFYNADLFESYEITDAECQHSWSVDNGLHAMTYDDEFDIAPQEYMDTYAFLEYEMVSYYALEESCEAMIGSTTGRECGGATDAPCFTANGCSSGYCTIPEEDYDLELAVYECMFYYTFASYDMVTDDEQYAIDPDYAMTQDFGSYMLEMGYTSVSDGGNITDPEGMAHEVALQLADAHCHGTGANDGSWNGVWKCPAIYPASWVNNMDDDVLRALCWISATPTNVTKCTNPKQTHCNWAATAGFTNVQCNTTLAMASGATKACIDSWGNVLTRPAGCYLYASSQSACQAMQGTWTSGFNYCSIPAYTTLALCNENLTIPAGFAQQFADTSFCYYKPSIATNMSQCVALPTGVWSPLLNLCIVTSTMVTDYPSCKSLNNTNNTIWFQKRAFISAATFTTAAQCTGMFCKNGEYGLDAATCANRGGSCNVKCTLCEGENQVFSDESALCYVPMANITQATCQKWHMAQWLANIGCVVPASSQTDCAAYTASKYVTCGAVSSCTNYVVNGTTLLYCSLGLDYCPTQKSCFANFECLDPLGKQMKTTTTVCVAACNAPGSPGNPAGDLDGNICVWYGKSNTTCITTMKGSFFKYPSSAAECNAFGDYCVRTLPGTLTSTADFATCSDCGTETPLFVGTAGVWTNYTLLPSLTIGYVFDPYVFSHLRSIGVMDEGDFRGPTSFVYPAMVPNVVLYYPNETSISNFETGFKLFMMGVKYIQYSSNMMKFEESALQKVACFCAGNYSDLDVCIENNEVTYADFVYTGEAANLTYPAMYPGGSVMTLHLPAGLQSGLVVHVKGKPITDIYYSAGSAKRATNIEVGIFDSDGIQLGDLTADGFDVGFSIQPLSADATMCVTKPDFLLVGDAFTVPDFSAYVDPTFTILNLDNTDFDVTAADATCTFITTSDFYFATMRATPTPSSSSVTSSLPLNLSSSSSGISTRNLALIALVCLVLLIIIPVVVIVVIVVVVRSKACKKSLRRVAPK